jgi:hypothetical protein
MVGWLCQASRFARNRTRIVIPLGRYSAARGLNDAARVCGAVALNVYFSALAAPLLGDERGLNHSLSKEQRHVRVHERSCCFFVCFHAMDWIWIMKRIAFLVCALVLVVANSAEARWRNRSNNMNYTQPVAATRVTALRPVTPAANDTEVATADAVSETSSTSEVATASHAASASSNVKTVSYSTATAQGVANLMASQNRVAHFGGNPGYEGCGCGASAAAAYSICCYGNSGMATVDVGYARSASGMWFCCRRYR